jgi:hypothetical protein
MRTNAMRLFTAIDTNAVLSYIHAPRPHLPVVITVLQTLIAISRLKIQNDHNSPFPLHYVPSHFSFNVLALDYQRLMSLLPPFCDDFIHEMQFGVREVVSRVPLRSVLQPCFHNRPNYTLITYEYKRRIILTD